MPRNFSIYQKSLINPDITRLNYNKQFWTAISFQITMFNRVGQLVRNFLFVCFFRRSATIGLKSGQKRSSETTCEDSFARPNKHDAPQRVSDHKSKRRCPDNDRDFGYYLAGLIEGDGHFSAQKHLVISFHAKDISSAYQIKYYIGHGSVRRVINKQAYTYIISNKAGIIKQLSQIDGKLRTESKYNQLKAFAKRQSQSQLPLDTFSSLMSNAWLSGFIDADGYFKLRMQNKAGRINSEIRQSVNIDQKTRDILDSIKSEFGGSISHRVKQNTYYYSSVNFTAAKQFVDYLCKYNLISYKHINFLKWRKAYRLISVKAHLTDKGRNIIKRLIESLKQE